MKKVLVLALAVSGWIFSAQTFLFTSGISTVAGSYQAPLYGTQTNTTTVILPKLTTTDSADTVKEIAQHLKNQETAFYIHISGKSALNQIKTIIRSAIEVDDYTHYVINGYNYRATWSDEKNITVTIKIDYAETKEQTTYVEAQVQSILKQIIKPGMTDFQKEKVIHDYIVSNVAYDTSLVIHSAYGFFEQGKTVCQGFALLTYRMLNDVGIENRIVEGKVRGVGHVWNEVLLEGKWYHLDTTFDDPVPFLKGRILYDYYNVTTAQLQKERVWDETQFPVANTNFASALQITASLIGKSVQGVFPVKVDGEVIPKTAIVIDGTSYLPVRVIGDAIGYNVSFNADSGIELKKK